jgi:tetratricopeptide (TPR) repeat protein/tRNA A-37 threonylcarbamoyl transferase component Bud32
MADPLLGRTVAHYEIVSRLGGGGMGVVYKARDRKLDRDVALKFLPQQWSHDEGAKQRFVREAQAASATHHPNICIIHDIATADDGQLFIVMGYYEGPTLKQRLEGGPLPVDEALDIATQVADGLAKAHAQGVVHRDIKPGNLILSDDGVRIVDFGLATFVDALQLTTEGSTIGTAAYMSPEQIRGEEVDARTDVWALGVVLYEMLTGHVPFRGSHAEAIAYAIRHDSPAPIRAERPDVPEDVEQLVFRAVHKDPAVRFGGAREVARALRQVRGLTLPQDLRTIPVDTRAAQAVLQTARPRRARRRWIIAAGVAVVVVGAFAAWLSIPVSRVSVAIVPISNQTGDSSLDDYRMALTHEVIAQLADAGSIRVLPYDRLQEIVERFRSPGRDISSRETVQAVATHSQAQVLLVPALVYDVVNREWKARIEVRSPTSAGITLESAAIKSSLAKDTAYRLSVELATLVRDHFLAAGPLRLRLAERLRRMSGRGAAPPASRLRTLDAAAAFERGRHWYEQVEYAAAREAFTAAAEADPRDPLSLAWRSRLAILMRQDREAVDAAERAVDLMRDSARSDDRLFIEAVVEEARRNPAGAEAMYRELASRHSDAAAGLLELAAFLDRQDRAADAAQVYQQALAVEPGLPRAHVELCRLYGRRDEPQLARTHGDTALKMYRDLDHQAGEALALWCLADVLRNGDDAERRQAASYADMALAMMERLQYPYGLARAHNYVGLVALSSREGARAASAFERTLAAAKAVGNVLLESRTLMNLGVAYEVAGQRAAALENYRDAFEVFERTGSQQDAAWTQVNAAGILIYYGGGPDQGLRDAQNALRVFENIGDKQFEVFARRVIALYHRNIGDYESALRELSLARNIARERNLDINLIQVGIDEARVRFAMGDYDRARELLLEIEPSASGTDAVHVDIERGRTHIRLGMFADAASDLEAAAEGIRQFEDVGSLPLLYEAQAELAYETGRLADARSLFARASDLWTGDLPEPASVEARAYVALLESAQRGADGAAALAGASLEQALKMRRVNLEARCRLVLARIAESRGRPADAISVLDAMPADRQKALTAELRAQLHYWRSRALLGTGDKAGGEREAMLARGFRDEAVGLLAEPYRAAVLSRTDLRFSW